MYIFVTPFTIKSPYYSFIESQISNCHRFRHLSSNANELRPRVVYVAADLLKY